jgi:hypothetical protein
MDNLNELNHLERFDEVASLYIRRLSIGNPSKYGLRLAGFMLFVTGRDSIRVISPY